VAHSEGREGVDAVGDARGRRRRRVDHRSRGGRRRLDGAIVLPLGLDPRWFSTQSCPVNLPDTSTGSEEVTGRGFDGHTPATALGHRWRSRERAREGNEGRVREEWGGARVAGGRWGSYPSREGGGWPARGHPRRRARAATTRRRRRETA
jgi:hypothetical protein